MPVAHALAEQLRKYADCLDRHPNDEMPKMYIGSISNDKETFIRSARAIPHPATKGTDGDSQYPYCQVQYEADGVIIKASVPQKGTCTIIRPAQPAVYDCDLLLTADEEEELTTPKGSLADVAPGWASA